MLPTTQSETLSPSLMRSLAEVSGPCVTVLIPGGANARLEFRKALEEVERELTANGSGEDLLRNLKEAEKHWEASPRSHGTELFLEAPGVSHHFSSSAVSSAPIVMVDDEFALRAILPLLSASADFYLLALSQNKTRVLHCTDSHAEEVPLPSSTPDNFDDSRQTKPPDHMLDGRSSGGQSAGAKGVMFGTSSDHEQKNEYLLNFYNMVNRGVVALLKDGAAPLVVVAVDHELALYRTVNTYKNTIEPGVHGAPDGMKGGEMHARALELLRSRPPMAIEHLLKEFDKSVGTGHGSAHAKEIVRSAYEGRVSHLFFQTSAEYRGNFDEIRRKVKRHADNIEPMHDLLNEAIAQTIRHGGEATPLEATHMPNGVPFCAIFRYPDTSAQTNGKTT